MNLLYPERQQRDLQLSIQTKPICPRIVLDYFLHHGNQEEGGHQANDFDGIWLCLYIQIREENLIITLERRLTHAGFMKASYKRRERKGQSTKCKS